MIVSYGGLYFEAGYDHMMPVSDMERTMGIDTETQNQEKAKPSTLIKGCQLEKFDLSCTLYRLFSPSPESIIAKLERLIAAKRPNKLLLGGRPVGKYRWLLVSVSVKYKTVDNSGGIIEAVISMSFEEFVKAGTKEKAQTNGVTAATPGVGTASIAVNDAYKVSDPTAQDRLDKKRTLDEKRLSKL